MSISPATVSHDVANSLETKKPTKSFPTWRIGAFLKILARVNFVARAIDPQTGFGPLVLHIAVRHIAKAEKARAPRYAAVLGD